MDKKLLALGMSLIFGMSLLVPLATAGTLSHNVLVDGTVSEYVSLVLTPLAGTKVKYKLSGDNGPGLDAVPAATGSNGYYALTNGSLQTVGGQIYRATFRNSGYKAQFPSIFVPDVMEDGITPVTHITYDMTLSK